MPSGSAEAPSGSDAQPGDHKEEFLTPQNAPSASSSDTSPQQFSDATPVKASVTSREVLHLVFIAV